MLKTLGVNQDFKCQSPYKSNLYHIDHPAAALKVPHSFTRSFAELTVKR